MINKELLKLVLKKYKLEISDKILEDVFEFYDAEIIVSKCKDFVLSHGYAVVSGWNVEYQATEPSDYFMASIYDTKPNKYPLKKIVGCTGESLISAEIFACETIYHQMLSKLYKTKEMNYKDNYEVVHNIKATDFGYEIEFDKLDEANTYKEFYGRVYYNGYWWDVKWNEKGICSKRNGTELKEDYNLIITEVSTS